MPFGTSFCLENQLERLSKQCKTVRKWSRSLVQIDENCVLHLVYTIKNVDEFFLTVWCVKNRSKSADFYCLNEKARPLGVHIFNDKLQLALTHKNL